MRRLLHAVIVLAGVIPWAVAMTCMWIVMQTALLADWVWPNATAGNCWSFTLPRWRRRGGYLAIRPSPRPFAFIPHAIWVYDLAGTHLEQTMPRKRARSVWQAWRAFYFEFRVVRGERRPGDTAPMPLGDQ